MRVAAFVDGFNLYHAINELRPAAPHFKWLDLWKLAEVIAPRGATVQAVYFCSAYPTWRHDGQLQRHRTYVSALQARNVTFVEGRFKTNGKNNCNRCGHEWPRREEKETDVNVAIHMLRGAHKDEWDLALLVCNDTDLTSTVKMLRADFPEKRIWMVTPPGRNTHHELKNAANGVTKLKPKHLRKALLPGTLLDANGNTIVRPSSYDPPSAP